MRDVKATGRSRGENENGGIRVGSRLGKKGRLCRKTFVRLLCLTAAMMVLGSFTAFARAGGASGGGEGADEAVVAEVELVEAAEAAEVVLPIIIQAAAGDKADGQVRFRRFCLREPL